MQSINIIKKLCEAPGNGKAYYRPFICKGELDNVNIFFVGINPATAIYPEDMELDKYVELLLGYDRFIEYYKNFRIIRGNSKFSRTRLGMNSFLEWLSKHTNSSIMETDVIPYPTENLKLLKKEPLSIIERGKDIFYELVIRFKPKLLILHGKETVEQIVDLFRERGLLPRDYLNLEQTIDEMEKKVPFVEFTYPDNTTGTIAVCRHFMYYGSIGNSFKDFREKLLIVLNKPLWK